jgi:hypothetical protein
MKLSVADICAILGLIVTCGGVLIYIGRQMSMLTTMSEGLKIVFEKTDRHEREISELKVDMKEVKTRQEDCNACP